MTFIFCAFAPRLSRFWTEEPSLYRVLRNVQCESCGVGHTMSYFMVIATFGAQVLELLFTFHRSILFVPFTQNWHHVATHMAAFLGPTYRSALHPAFSHTGPVCALRAVPLPRPDTGHDQPRKTAPLNSSPNAQTAGKHSQFRAPGNTQPPPPPPRGRQFMSR